MIHLADTSGKEEGSGKEKKVEGPLPTEEQTNGALRVPEGPDLTDRSSQWSFTSKDGSGGWFQPGGTGPGKWSSSLQRVTHHIDEVPNMVMSSPFSRHWVNW